MEFGWSGSVGVLMKHGEYPDFCAGLPEHHQAHTLTEDERLIARGLSMPIGEFLLLERALCSCEGKCACDD
jgi:hypothetical protein